MGAPPRSQKVPKLSKFELEIMEHLWNEGESSVRSIQESFSEKRRPAYTTVLTIVNRLERKSVVKRIAKIGKSFIYAPSISRTAAQHRLVSELLSLFGGRIQLVLAHLIQVEDLTPKDLTEARKLLDERTERGQSK